MMPKLIKQLKMDCDIYTLSSMQMDIGMEVIVTLQLLKLQLLLWQFYLWKKMVISPGFLLMMIFIKKLSKKDLSGYGKRLKEIAFQLKVQAILIQMEMDMVIIFPMTALLIRIQWLLQQL